MTLKELLDEWERRRLEATRHHSSAPMAAVYGVVIEELRGLDGQSAPGRLMTTGEAGSVLRLSPKTVRRWCVTGRFPHVVKTGEEKGEWRIPADDVYRLAGSRVERTETIPKLWRPDDEQT